MNPSRLGDPGGGLHRLPRHAGKPHSIFSRSVPLKSSLFREAMAIFSRSASWRYSRTVSPR